MQDKMTQDIIFFEKAKMTQDIISPQCCNFKTWVSHVTCNGAILENKLFDEVSKLKREIKESKIPNKGRR